MSAPLMTSGIGQYHTNEPDPKKPTKILKPYLVIGVCEIRALVDNPQQVDKTLAQWLIPSTYPSRNFKEQEKHGEYWALWADFDTNPPTLSALTDSFEDLLDGCDFELYNSRSATPDNQKARGLIFLDKPLCYADWRLVQETLNDKLEALGITPDRANERSAQVCYLPNKGALYSSEVARNDNYFNPMQSWAQEIATKREKIASEALALEAAQRSSMAKKATLKLSDAPDLIGAFNQAYTPHEWMLQAGYVQRGESFRHPFSDSGSYSATCQFNAKGELRVNALSLNDRLYTDGNGAHDAFSVYATLFHNGDTKAALIDAGDNLLAIGSLSWNKAKRLEWASREQDKTASSAEAKASTSHNETLDNNQHYCSVDFLKHVDDGHLLKRLSISIANATNLPVHTVFIAGLGVFSSATARRYKVNYQHGGELPTGLYAVLEQPSGTAKSRTLGIFQRPFYEVEKEVKAAAMDDEQVIKNSLFTTNSTPEALEQTLIHSGGYFSAVSSEQGLFNTLLGACYSGDKASNNDLLLNGFDAGFMSSKRVGREGYSGTVVGNAVMFAQGGGIENLLKQSNGTGLAERFLLFAEKHGLGARDFTKSTSVDSELVKQYNALCKPLLLEALSNPTQYDCLPSFDISAIGWRLIAEYRNSIEKHLADGGRYSHVAIRGAASKIDMQIMKLAANLQASDVIQDVIADNHVKAAIGIANELLEANLKMCTDKGIVGIRAEYSSILSLFEHNTKPRSERNIIQSKSGNLPFKDFTGNKSELIRETLLSMVKDGVLQITYSVEDLPVKQYSPAQ